MPTDSEAAKTWDDLMDILEDALVQLKNAAEALDASTPDVDAAAAAVRSARQLVEEATRFPPGTFPTVGDDPHATRPTRPL